MEKILQHSQKVQNINGDWVVKVFWPEQDLRNYIKILYPLRTYGDWAYDRSTFEIVPIYEEDWEAFASFATTLGYTLKLNVWY